MDIENYKPKNDLALDIASDLLRELELYADEENAKKVCLLLEMFFEK